MNKERAKHADTPPKILLEMKYGSSDWAELRYRIDRGVGQVKLVDTCPLASLSESVCDADERARAHPNTPTKIS